MAGKDHHHVWRMLQRGFGERRYSENHVWVYRKNKQPKQRGTGNFGVEKYFYGPENSETDRKITEFENSIQGDVYDTRDRPNGYELDTKFVAPLIAHLEVRSKFLRSELSHLTERMVDALDHHFSSPQKIREMVKAYLKNHPDKIEKLLDANFVPPEKKSQAARMFDAYLETLPAQVIKEHFNTEVSGIFEEAHRLPETMKDMHNKAILSLALDSPRIRKFGEFNFFVYRPEEGQLILPDTCCVFVGENSVSPFSQPKDNIRNVIVPISSDVAIVGWKKQPEALRLKTVNRLLAGCAYDAFIANRDNNHYSSLSGRIGKYATLMTDSEIKELFAFEQMLAL